MNIDAPADEEGFDPEELEEEDDGTDPLSTVSLPITPKPINWHLLRSHEAEQEWLDLNQWVNQLRETYGLPASVVPPFWHRHPELVWERLCAAHALAVQLRPRTGRVGADRVAHRFRARPRTAPRMGGHLRHPPGSRPANSADHLAW